jgi:hypothetical protein
VDESADRVARLMAALADRDPALSGWRNQAYAQTLVTIDHTDLVKRLLDSRHRGDLDNEVIESLGSSLHWWNGVGDYHRTAVNLYIHIGDGSLGNSVVLNLPDPDAVPSLYSYETAHNLLRTFVEIFNPDSVLWSNHDLVDKQRGPDRPTEDGRGIISGRLVGEPAGWANYLSDSNPVKFDVGLLPASATVEHLGAGTLVMLGKDVSDPSLDDVLQIRRAMGYEVPTQLPRPQVAADGPMSSANYADAVSSAQSLGGEPSGTEQSTKTGAVPNPEHGSDAKERGTEH